MKLHEIQGHISIRVTGGWEWLLATIMQLDGVNRGCLQPVGSRPGGKSAPTINNRLCSHLYIFLGSEEVSASIKPAASAVSGIAET